MVERKKLIFKPDDGEEFPSLREQTKTLGSTLAKSFKGMLAGDEIMVSEDEQQRRYDLCQVCEHFSKQQKRCKECGCYLKQKIKFKVSECPIGKW